MNVSWLPRRCSTGERPSLGHEWILDPLGGTSGECRGKRPIVSGRKASYAILTRALLIPYWKPLPSHTAWRGPWT